MNAATAAASSVLPSTTDSEASRIVAEIGIPPCPAVLTAVLRESRKDDPDFTIIGRLISRDLGLAAAMLKTVNSPFYGLTNKATSVQQALVLLGVVNAARLVTGLLLRQVFSVYRNPVMSQLWESSSRMAAGTARLARSLRCADRDEAHTFGLFRDCGMLLMSRKYDNYSDLLRAGSFPHPGSLLLSEAQLYVTDHARVGAHMAGSWYLPRELCLAVRHHHDLEFLLDASDHDNRRTRILSALGMLVDHIARASNNDAPDDEWNLSGGAVLACLGLQEADVPALATCVLEAQAQHQTEAPE